MLVVAVAIYLSKSFFPRIEKYLLEINIVYSLISIGLEGLIFNDILLAVLWLILLIINVIMINFKD